MADNSDELDSQQWESHFFYAQSSRQMEPVARCQFIAILAKQDKLYSRFRLESILIKEVDNA